MNIPKIQKIVSILWPSFIMAGIATTVFFTVFDPDVLLMDKTYGDISRIGAYSIGFFLFWALTVSSCMLTCYFLRPCHRINKT